MFILTILEKIKEMRLKFCHGSVTVSRWPIMKKAIAKLTNTQLSKLQYATKNKTGTALRITKKSF